MEKSKDNLTELVSSRVNSGSNSSCSRLDDRSPYSLSHLAHPETLLQI